MIGRRWSAPRQGSRGRAGRVDRREEGSSRAGRVGRREEGSGTILVLVAVMVLGFAGTVAVVLGSAAVVRHRAEAAADLAALAAASAAANGGPPACAVAQRVAARNGAALASCRVQGSTVEVSVTRHLSGVLGGLPAARARAKAGPAS